MPDTTLVLVNGAWHLPEAWNELKGVLGSDVKTVAVKLRSVVPEGAEPHDMHEDADEIRRVIIETLDKGDNVVPVVHSYAGVPTSDACQGLLLADRKKEGKSNGVIGIVYLSSFALPVGAPLWNKTQMPDGMYWWKMDSKLAGVDNPHKIFYNKLSEAEAQPYIDRLQMQSISAWLQPARYAIFEHAPSAYLLCKDDNAIPIDTQRMIVGLNQRGYDLTREIDADHSPFLGSTKTECAQFIEEAVSKFESMAA